MERSRSAYYQAKEYQVNPEIRGRKKREKKREKEMLIILFWKVSD